MSLLILNARIPVCSRLVPETHFSEYSLSILGVMMGMGGGQIQRELNNQCLPLKNSQCSEANHQCIKWHEKSYKATNQQVQTNTVQHKLNACGNVWLPKQQDGARHFGP